MTTFQDLQISPEILRALLELGFEAPTPIQAETLPLLLEGNTDFLGLAATGTGKTAAFGIPLLERIQQDQKGVQALVLCPTRELAMQVAGQLNLMGKYLGVKALPIYGGTGYGDQIYGLKSGANVVVGTPGRVVDHLEKGTLRLDQLKTLVLDEADEMISMGFKEDLETVLQGAPEGQANIWLFSATMGPEVQHVANAYLRDPKRVQINKTEMLSENVQQIFYKTKEFEKPEVLCKLIDAADDFYGIVFCQTKALVADLQQLLVSKGYRADCLHGDLDQAARDRVMRAFRDRNISILVATDVACRGLDVKDVTHVVNYSIPLELDNYVHRIGRTARSGKSGLALSLVTYSHRDLIGRIERMTKSRMTEGVIPTAKDIALIRLNKVRAAFEKSPQGRATAMIPEEWKQALAAMPPAEIAGRFLGLMLPDLFADNKVEERPVEARPAPVTVPTRPERREERREGRRPEGRFDRPRTGDRPRFQKFGGKKNFRSSAPRSRDDAWQPQGAPGGNDLFAETREHAPKSRWKNNFAAKPALAPVGDKPLKKKKKLYGHWKPKSQGPGA